MTRSSGGDLLLLLGVVYLVASMFEVGLAPLTVEKKREGYRHVARGLLLNLALVPALTILVIRLAHPAREVEQALLVLAAAPGGGTAPYLARLARGNVRVAGEITLFLGKITVFSAPVLARRFLGLHELEIRELPFMLELLLLQMIPLLIARYVRRRHDALATRLERPVHLMVVAITVTVLAILVAAGGASSLRLMGVDGCATVVLLASLSFVVAWLLGGRTGEVRRGVAGAINARNMALSLVVATSAGASPQMRMQLFAAWALLYLSGSALAWVAGRLASTAPELARHAPGSPAA